MSLYDMQAFSDHIVGFLCAFTISKKNISEASKPIFIRFNGNHHWIGRFTALDVGADCIKIVVSMSTNSSHGLTMEKKNIKKVFFSETTSPKVVIFCV